MTKKSILKEFSFGLFVTIIVTICGTEEDGSIRLNLSLYEVSSDGYKD